MVKPVRSPKQLIAEGRDAVLAHHFKNAPPPTNRYSRSSKAHFYFQRGVDRTRPLVDQIMDIGQ